MTHRNGRQLLRIWLALLLFTAASVVALRHAGGIAGVVLVLSLAMLKARFVVLDFMGLREAKVISRALTGWCLFLAASATLKGVIIVYAGG